MIRIVTDSAATLPAGIAEQYNIEVVPLYVKVGQDTYREGINLSDEEFFARLPSANPLPTTSQPSPADFENVYRPIIEAGDEILSIHISSPLSGTYNSARNAIMAMDNPPISVVDTLSVSPGTSLIVIAAARMAQAGKSREEIVAKCEELAQQVLLVLTLDTLEYLRKGGRIGGAQAFLGGLLRVKPVIYLKDGKLQPGERARSRRKAIEQLVEMEKQRFGNQPLWVIVAQANANDLNELEAQARSGLNVQELWHCNIGPVVSTHTGPNALGIAAIPAPQM
jgi:DegV family protein with EDD domain